MLYRSIQNQILNVMHWNARGITTKASVTQFEDFLHEEQIDDLYINETFLSRSNKIQLFNYFIYREDRSMHGGGVLIAIKKSIPHQSIPKILTSATKNI